MSSDDLERSGVAREGVYIVTPNYPLAGMDAVICREATMLPSVTGLQLQLYNHTASIQNLVPLDVLDLRDIQLLLYIGIVSGTYPGWFHRAVYFIAHLSHRTAHDGVHMVAACPDSCGRAILLSVSSCLSQREQHRDQERARGSVDNREVAKTGAPILPKMGGAF